MKMHLNIKTILTGFLISLLCCNAGLAADYWSLNDLEKFPIQNNFLGLAEQDFINPFKITAWNFGIVYPRFHRNFSKDFRSTVAENKWFNTWKKTNFEMQYELPFHEKNSSLGLDTTVYLETPPIIAYFYAVLQGKDQRPNLMSTWEETDAVFENLIACEILGTYKYRYQFQNRLGHFGGFVKPKIGPIVILLGSGVKEVVSKTLRTSIDTESRIGYLGLVGGVSVGFDWYFSQWIGCFVEFSMKYNYLPFSRKGFGKDLFTITGPQDGPFDYTTTAFTFGLKTTY